MLNDKVANFLVKDSRQLDDAKLFENSTQRPFHFQLMTFLLDTATVSGQPQKIGFPFKAITVVNASDSATQVNLQFDGFDDIVPKIPLKQNNTLNFDEPINEAYITWTAQSGKSITILFAIDCEMSVGTTTTAISGGIFQQDGTAVAAIASVTLAAATAGIIAPALSTRKTCTLVNNCPDTLYLGGSAAVTADAAATGGIPVTPGATFEWRNTGALYAISTAGGLVNRLEES